ncbi:MAG: T9SS type A sorting domain-containing protein [Algibacter sp.]|nr:T9SS type A sorting domain-containing protein [Algibacter sp.]MDG2179417.1 T9SS type A sorting domain-containing protein [Algibacter sp.]
MINGSVSAKGRVNYTVVEGDVIRGEVNGTTYKVFINDNLVHTIVNPSGANTSGNPGIMVEGYAIDDWSGGDINNSAADCDDTDASVNPGETEIVGNGIDDDCNPATLDIIDVSKVSAIVGNKTVGTLGLDNFESLENKIKIYPNPFKDNITIKLPLSYNNSQLNIKIFDISGRLVFDKKYLSINRTINASGMSNLEQATYLVTITSQKTGKSIFKQLIKL